VVSTKGRLLIATPPLADPNFDRSVVLMLEHNEEGAFGIVLNRPTHTPVAAVLPDWAELAMWPTFVFTGGPVQPDAVIALARRSGGVPDDAEGWVPVLGDLGTVDLAQPAADAVALSALRVFSGYSGWGPGQLDGELDMDAWIVVDAEPTDPFTADPDLLWRQVLGRQPGTLSWLRLYPDNVEVN
jgi:putative transcriptional regulator